MSAERVLMYPLARASTGASVTAWMLPGSTRLLVVEDRLTGATVTSARASVSVFDSAARASSRRCRGRYPR